MIQLIDSLPFTDDFDTLKADWQRFQDGKVIFSEIPDAICGEFDCEAEIQIFEDEIEDDEGCAGTGDDIEGAKEADGDSNTENINDKADDELLNNLPSGTGKLILTASKLYWIKSSSASESPMGWSVDYKNVLLHAISKPSDSRPHLYLQLSCNKLIDCIGQEVSFKSDFDEDDKFVEINLYVEDEKSVDEMFVILSECASLHPCDDSDSDSEHAYEEEQNDRDFSEPERKLNKIDMERFEDAAEK